MKKILCALLSVTLLSVSLAGCGNKHTAQTGVSSLEKYSPDTTQKYKITVAFATVIFLLVLF